MQTLLSSVKKIALVLSRLRFRSWGSVLTSLWSPWSQRFWHEVLIDRSINRSNKARQLNWGLTLPVTRWPRAPVKLGLGLTLPVTGGLLMLGLGLTPGRHALTLNSVVFKLPSRNCIRTNSNNLSLISDSLLISMTLHKTEWDFYVWLTNLLRLSSCWDTGLPNSVSKVSMTVDNCCHFVVFHSTFEKKCFALSVNLLHLLSCNPNFSTPQLFLCHFKLHFLLQHFGSVVLVGSLLHFSVLSRIWFWVSLLSMGCFHFLQLSSPAMLLIFFA